MSGIGTMLWSANTCILDRCAFARYGVVALVREIHNSKCVEFSEHTQIIGGSFGFPPVALIYRLPEKMAGVLDALLFLRSFLNSTPVWDGGRNPIVVMTDWPAHWLYGTLCCLVLRDKHMRHIYALPARSSLEQIKAVLMGKGGDWQLQHLAAQVPLTQRDSLTVREVEVLRDLLYLGRSIQLQARLKGVSPKTLYTQQRSAMRKLGVSSLVGVIRWRGR